MKLKDPHINLYVRFVLVLIIFSIMAMVSFFSITFFSEQVYLYDRSQRSQVSYLVCNHKTSEYE